METVKNRNKALLWVTLIFVIGTLFGATTTYLWFQVTTAADSDPAAGRETEARFNDKKEHSHQHLLERLSALLDLDQEQQKQLTAILEKSHQRFNEINEESRQKSSAVRQKAREELRSILNAKQLKKFDEYLQERRRKKAGGGHDQDSGKP